MAMEGWLGSHRLRATRLGEAGLRGPRGGPARRSLEPEAEELQERTQPCRAGH